MSNFSKSNYQTFLVTLKPIAFDFENSHYKFIVKSTHVSFFSLFYLFLLLPLSSHSSSLLLYKKNYMVYFTIISKFYYLYLTTLSSVDFHIQFHCSTNFLSNRLQVFLHASSVIFIPFSKKMFFLSLCIIFLFIFD